MSLELNCRKCRLPFEEDVDDNESYGTGLCYHCFEESLEDYEIGRRERIAIANEY